MNEKELEGFLLINKPVGVTSRYCVNRIVSIIKSAARGKTKVGHAGTLDLLANGLLIIGIGRTATREIKHFLALDKRYIATAKLGQWTDSLDCNGQVLQDDMPIDTITRFQLEDAIHSLGHEYWQVPPLYSALKHHGERLSELARSKKITQQELERIAKRKQRLIDLYSIKVTEFALPFFTIAAHVSHGTYIRTLVDDIAQKVETHATTHELMRTTIGPFTLEQSLELSDLETIEDIEKNLISVDTMLQKIQSYSVGVE